MKCTIPEISWHNRDPVLSVDIQPNCRKNELYRLASGGIDCHVLIWYMSLNKNGSVNLDLAADLTRHQRAVNVVKWSPNGDFLASGDDESVIFIWKQKNENELLNIVDATTLTTTSNNEQDKEIWVVMKILRGHLEDIYDLCWSKNSQYLISGSVDNTARIWDVQMGKSLCILEGHEGFVQGVAWDPLNQYIATLSTDRYLRIFDVQTKKIISRSSKCTLSFPEGHELNGKAMRIFHDDTLQTFFRRLNFSPDGKLLIVPAGVIDYDGCLKQIHTTYIYSRYSLKQPAIVLPSPDQYTVAVKCCPVLFKLRCHTESNAPAVPLPYRIIFAVATKSSVYLYDTQQKIPFGLISNIHYTRLTDLTWSDDAKILVVSSTDGFCSLITFSEGELGEIYYEEEIIKKNQENVNKSSENNSNEELNKSDKINEYEDDEKRTDNEVEMKDISQQYTEEVKSCITNENIKQCQQETSEVISTVEIRKTPEKIIGNKNNIENTLILDKNVISSAEKFETPEKKDCTATPISVRRHPRNNITTSSPTIKMNFLGKIDKEQTLSKLDKVEETQKPKGSKKATPIAIRRQPRTLIPNPNLIEATTIVEEAVDSWPSNVTSINSVKEVINQVANNVEEKQKCSESIKINQNLDSNIMSQSVDSTDDIHLIYEETQEEEEEENVSKEKNESNKKLEENQLSKTPKTHKRVELKTISVPKK